MIRLTGKRSHLLHLANDSSGGLKAWTTKSFQYGLSQHLASEIQGSTSAANLGFIPATRCSISCFYLALAWGFMVEGHSFWDVDVSQGISASPGVGVLWGE